jgi:hypothetical protein
MSTGTAALASVALGCLAGSVWAATEGARLRRLHATARTQQRRGGPRANARGPSARREG